MLIAVRRLIGDRRPVVLPGAVDLANALPYALRALFCGVFDLPAGTGIVRQTGAVERGRLNGHQRVTSRFTFSGPVTAAAEYLLVDDRLRGLGRPAPQPDTGAQARDVGRAARPTPRARAAVA